MRLANWCALCAGALLAIGLAPGAAGQLELAAPGVQVFEGQQKLYDILIVGHGLMLAVCAPLAVAALGLAVRAEAKGARAWAFASLVLLGVSLLSTVAVVAVSISGVPIATAISDLAVIASALILLLSAIAVASAFKRLRAAPIFLWLSASLFAFALLLTAVLSNSGMDAVLYDTYYELARTHSLGVADILLTLAIFTAYVEGNANRPGGWFGALFGVLICVSGGLAVLFTAILGLKGIPRRYFDYPDVFAGSQLQLSICMAALVLVAMAACAVLGLRARAKA